MIGQEHLTKVKQQDHQSDRPACDTVQQKRAITIIGDVASVLSVIMYVSYVPQIMANLSGDPGVVWQPLAAFFNCCFWTIYGIGAKPRQWPIIIANIPGIFLAAITAITCFVH